MQSMNWEAIAAIGQTAGSGCSKPFRQFVASAHAEPDVEFPFDALSDALRKAGTTESKT